MYLNIPPYLKYIATLPLKYICSNNGYAQEVIEANCHVKLSQTKKTVSIYLSGKIFIISFTNKMMFTPAI